jgi:ABC-type hemin transport system substrate-binding protein
VTLADLERVRAREFSEILPILEKLVQLDLMRRLPTEHVVGYEPTPMLIGKQEKPKQEKSSGED